MRQRIRKPKRIDLDSINHESSTNISDISPEDNCDFYDPTDDFTLEELEEMGVIEIPKTKLTPDGESEFYIAFKQGEDF